MISEVDVFGVYLAPIVLYGAVAALIFAVVRAVLGWTGVLRWLWHPALAECAIYVAILSLLVQFF